MNTNEKKLKCGVAGVGYLGRHHARIYNELKDCEFVGVCDIDAQRAQEICVAYGCRQFSSIQELGEACDIVSVVVPTPNHCEVSVELLKAGAHLLIEKPLCMSLEEADTIASLAKAKKRIVQVGHVEHYNPVMSFLEEAVKDPKYITADRLAPFNPRGTEVGVVLDLMIHDIGIILELVKSPVRRIESIGVSVLSGNEDIANARITFENGCVANLNASRVSEKKLREIRVFQPQAYLSLDFMEQKGHIVNKEYAGLVREEIPIQRGEPLMLEIRSFVDCVQKALCPKVSTELGSTALDVALQITEQITQVCRSV